MRNNHYPINFQRAGGFDRQNSQIHRRLRAFSLMELLVVISIIGILAAVALPALKGMGKGSQKTAAQRQLQDDLSLARQIALKDRATVYMVFVPSQIATDPTIYNQFTVAPQRADSRVFTNVLGKQMVSYALMSSRRVGDQPGAERPRYLTDWKTLPDGIIIDPSEFLFVADVNQWMLMNPTNRPMQYAAVPFPTATNLPMNLPVLAFNSQGRLFSQNDEFIDFIRGSVFPARDNNLQFIPGAADILVEPNQVTNTIQVNWLTGRANVLQPNIPE